MLPSETPGWDACKDGTAIKATPDVTLVTFQLYALAHKAQQLKKQVGVEAGEHSMSSMAFKL